MPRILRHPLAVKRVSVPNVTPGSVPTLRDIVVVSLCALTPPPCAAHDVVKCVRALSVISEQFPESCCCVGDEALALNVGVNVGVDGKSGHARKDANAMYPHLLLCTALKNAQSFFDSPKNATQKMRLFAQNVLPKSEPPRRKKEKETTPCASRRAAHAPKARRARRVVTQNTHNTHNGDGGVE